MLFQSIFLFCGPIISFNIQTMEKHSTGVYFKLREASCVKALSVRKYNNSSLEMIWENVWQSLRFIGINVEYRIRIHGFGKMVWLEIVSTGFVCGRSLLRVFEEVIKNVDEGRVADAVQMGFSQAFDDILHDGSSESSLIEFVMGLMQGGSRAWWWRLGWRQWLEVCLRGSVLDLSLVIHINDLDETVQS